MVEKYLKRQSIGKRLNFWGLIKENQKVLLKYVNPKNT